jgi:hypothetical protein
MIGFWFTYNHWSKKASPVGEVGGVGLSVLDRAFSPQGAHRTASNAVRCRCRKERCESDLSSVPLRHGFASQRTAFPPSASLPKSGRSAQDDGRGGTCREGQRIAERFTVDWLSESYINMQHLNSFLYF